MIAQVRRVVDEDDDVIRGWLLDRIRRMIAESKWRKVAREIGPTVAGEYTYTVDDDVVDVANLWIGGHNYAPVNLDEFAELTAGRSWVRGARGAFGPLFAIGAEQGFVIWPTPETGGDSILAILAVLPPDTTDGEEPPIPADLQHHIWRGAIADGLGVGDEDPQAAKWEAEYREGVDLLTERARSRLKKSKGRVRVPTY
jgi:hypothetical protein